MIDSKTGQARDDLQLAFPWMEEQPLSNHPIPAEDWTYLNADELPPGEDLLDVAVAPLRRSPFTGITFGRSLQAIDLRSCDLDDPVHSLGDEVATVGLIAYHSGVQQGTIGPAVRFGRVSLVPQGPVVGALGLHQEVLLIESFATGGMSGAPVFRRRGDGFVWFGVHAGHLRDADGFHSGLSMVVPAVRIIDLVNIETLQRERAMVETKLHRAPWRFLDRRHRERNAIVLQHKEYASMSDNAEEVFPWEYLFFRRNHDYPAEPWPDEWNSYWVEPLGSLEHMRELVGRHFVSPRWDVESDRLQEGTARLPQGAVVRIQLYHVRGRRGPGRGVEVLLVACQEHAIDDQILCDILDDLAPSDYVDCYHDTVT